MRRISSFCKDDSGATAIEYAMIAAFIAIGIIGSVTSVGTTVAAIFDSVGPGFAPSP